MKNVLTFKDIPLLQFFCSRPLTQTPDGMEDKLLRSASSEVLTVLKSMSRTLHFMSHQVEQMLNLILFLKLYQGTR